MHKFCACFFHYKIETYLANVVGSAQEPRGRPLSAIFKPPGCYLDFPENWVVKEPCDWTMCCQSLVFEELNNYSKEYQPEFLYISTLSTPCSKERHWVI